LQESYELFKEKSAGAEGKGTLILKANSDAVVPRSTVKQERNQISNTYNGDQPGFAWEDIQSSCRRPPSRI
jgi:hypothetical protein